MLGAFACVVRSLRGFSGHFCRHGREAGLLGKRLHHRVIVTNFEAALRVVRAGLAIALVPREVTRLYADAYGLAVLPLVVRDNYHGGAQELACLMAGAGQCSLPAPNTGSCSTSGNAKAGAGCVGQTGNISFDP